MNIILLCGGSGKRLWPLSNDVRSKQFLKIFPKRDGIKESMVQRMYRMIKEIDPDAKVTIASSENQISQIRAQLGEDVDISVEPQRKDTFPAISLASAYLKKKGVNEEEPIVICPVDPYVEEDYFKCLKELSDEADYAESKLILMGIEPTYPSEKYGYIIPLNKNHKSLVLEFKEKPDKETAREYIKKGALWNAGVFAFKLEYLLNIARTFFGTDDYDELLNRYDSLQKISFDYAVAEKEESISVIRFNGAWKDLGTWNTLTEAMDEQISGNATANECINTHIINELSIPIISLGIRDSVIVATPDGILVSNKAKSSELKNYVTNKRPMYERRSWGEYKVLDYKHHEDGSSSLTKELIISKDQHISYQRHQHRTEIWTFTEGKAKLVIDGNTKTVSRGDVAIIKPNMKHGVKALSEVHIIEVQIGDELTEEDIERLDWNWK